MDPAKVIIRFKDGRKLKGYVRDFFSGASSLGFRKKLSDKETSLVMDDLKAIFFVRDLEGNPGYTEKKEFSRDRDYVGKKVRVTYQDGEVAFGTVLSYNPKRSGFLMVPSDENSNNLKIFVVSSAVRELAFLQEESGGG